MKVLFTLLTFICVTASQAQQPGIIDKTYGNDKGAEIVSNAGTETLMFSSAIQADDKLVTGGEDSLNDRFVLSRHNKDGSVDLSFGTKGRVVTEPDLSVYVFGVGNGWTSIAIQPDGKIVTSGLATKYGPGGGNNLFNSDILIARFLSDGTPDKDFGINGIMITDLNLDDEPFGIAVQNDGKIIAGGQTSGRLLVLRFDTDGSSDKSFGNGNGYVLSSVNYTTAHAIALQPDGKILAGGGYNLDRYFFAERFLTDGNVDNSFGQSGTVTTTVGNTSSGNATDINSLAIDSKGRIVAVGDNAYSQITVVRYLPDGTLDKSFDKDGIKYISFPNSSGYDYSKVVLLPNPDKIIIAGYTFTINPTYDFALAALNAADGSFDSTFGTDGQVITDFGYNEVTYGTVLQSDGKIVLISSDEYNPNYVYIIARFNGYPVHVSLAVRIRRWLQNHTLSWQGLPSEDKIISYSVEQSADGSSGFAQVAKVSGRGNLKDYSVTNSHLLTGANYYRIKAVSTDGVVRYSEVVSADNSAASASVYPNPARDYVTVQGLKSMETADIAIKDGSGNVLARGVSNGSGQYRSSLGSNMQPGTYYLNITTGSKTEVLKFVKE